MKILKRLWCKLPRDVIIKTWLLVTAIKIAYVKTADVTDPEAIQSSHIVRHKSGYCELYTKEIEFARTKAECLDPILSSDYDTMRNGLYHEVFEKCLKHPVCSHCWKQIRENKSWKHTEKRNLVITDQESKQMCFRKLKSKKQLFENQVVKVDFHCTNYSKTYSTNNTEETFFKLSYIDTNMEKQPRKKHPSIFVVEKEVLVGENLFEISFTTTVDWIFGLRTDFNARYSIRVTPVSPALIFLPASMDNISLEEPSSSNVYPPLNLTVTLNEVINFTTRPSAMLRWRSGSKFPSCEYDIFFLTDEQLKNERKHPSQAFWMKLENLKFNHKYEVHIIELFPSYYTARYGQLKGNISFNVKSCLEITSYNFSQCPPPPVQNVTLRLKGVKSLLMTWKPPIHTSLSNKVLTYQIDVYKLGDVAVIGKPRIIEPSHIETKIVSGEQNSLLVEMKPTFKGKIKVSIAARSKAGNGKISEHFIEFRGENTVGQTLKRIWIALLVLVIFVALIAILLCLKSYKEKLRHRKIMKDYIDNLDKEIISSPPLRNMCFAKWEIESGCLTLGDAIGEGAFGLVRKAILYQNGRRRTVAVKTLRSQIGDLDDSKFWEEFKILKNLEPNRHVVGLIGIVKNHVPGLVVEYCCGGDLQTYLRKVLHSRINSARTNAGSVGAISESSLSSTDTRIRLSMVTNEAYFLNYNFEDGFSNSDLLSFARQIACGMDFLSKNKIVHRDLAARNVLLAENKILKIADFGLSRDVYEQNWYKKSSKGMVPIRWLALECLLQEVYTTKSDVWSYGITLWEIVTLGGNPYPGISNVELFDMLKSGYRMPKPDNCPDNLYSLMTRCWDEIPLRRPDFSEVKKTLDEIIEVSCGVTYMNLKSGQEEREEVSLEEESNRNIPYGSSWSA